MRFLEREHFQEQKALCVHDVKSHQNKDPQREGLPSEPGDWNPRPALTTYHLLFNFVAGKDGYANIQGSQPGFRNSELLQ